MTTIATNDSSLSKLILLGATAVAIALAIGVSPDGDVEVGRHALEGHGPDAITAYAWTTLFGKFHKWDCPDGKIRTVVHMWKNRWAVRVESSSGNTITAFTSTDRDYVKGMIDPCDNHWRYAHP